ncbi:MAG: alcohol dehydrogenase catalytic domain-containing protein [Oscillospiraceae bacterium]|nr:alcohol dehydrogenase catalytic domain-containing protein [Oscillospiraceae bacterium]
MKAVVYQEKGRMALEERPRPQLLHEKDAIVRVTLSSICSSDLHIKHGAVEKAKPGTIVGHEFVGVVEEVGSAVTKLRPGQRVAASVETFCGECFFCKNGYVNNCTDPDGGWALGCRIDGGQAEYVRVPLAENGLTPIPDTVSDESALFTGDILSTGFWAAELAEIKAGDTVAVISAGPTGLCALMCTHLYSPARTIVIDVSDDRLALAKARGLADVCLNPLHCDVEAEVLRRTGGRGADATLEVAGGPDTFDLAWRIARPSSVVCVVALYDRPQSLPLPSMYGKNLTFKTGGVDACKLDRILRLIEAGKIDTNCLITHRLPLSRAMEAYELFEQKRDGVIKVVLTPEVTE